ncbi:hypothetical protein F5B18DRAFT_600373 [Nemania serpens]|nr:hypothetical protein F5B18DRAFT_600373 [Nemania serpens]
MESQQELCSSSDEGNQTGSPNENIFSGPAENHMKPRPSVDIGLAQGYREKQNLPTVGQEPSEDVPQAETGYVKIMLDESLRSYRDRLTVTSSLLSGPETDDGKPSRCKVTGRVLSEHARSCLRCTEKGLRCTFNFIGKEDETQCAACRRNKTQYCIRFQLPRENRKRKPFQGLPWKNPNFTAGTPAGSGAPEIPSEELEAILHEFYIGPSGQVMGDYLMESDAQNFALPPFNGADLPPEQRPDDYETMNWRDVLPDWRNRSLRPRPIEGEEAEEHENRKKRLALARERSIRPVRIDEEDEEEEVINRGKRAMAKMTMQSASDGEQGGDRIRLLRALRKYEPREKNLDDILGETW